MILAVFIFSLAIVVMFRVESAALRWYFFALAVYQIPVWFAWLYMREEYFCIYSTMTAVLLIAEFAVAIEALEHSRTRMLTLLLAAGIPSALAWAALQHSRTAADYETIIEDGLLTAYAIVVGQSAVAMRQPIVAGLLALSWLAQSAFGFGYMLNVGSRSWYLANESVPALINVVMLSFIMFIGVRYDRLRTS